MMFQSKICHFFVFCTWATIVGIGVNADATTRCEDACDLNVLRVHETDEVFHDDVHAVLVEIAMIAEGEQVELE